MPLTNYAVDIRESATGVGVSIFRNPATVPVANTSAVPSVLSISSMQGQFTSPAVVGVVSAASNATPIVLTVDNGSSWANGDLAYVAGVNGNTNANGTFFTTVSSNALTLIGSAGNAAFSSSPNGRARKILKGNSFHVALATAMAAIFNDKAAGN
jgi:hypothetical protein